MFPEIAAAVDGIPGLAGLADRAGTERSMAIEIFKAILCR